MLCEPKRAASTPFLTAAAGAALLTGARGGTHSTTAVACTGCWLNPMYGIGGYGKTWPSVCNHSNDKAEIVMAAPALTVMLGVCKAGAATRRRSEDDERRLW